MSLIISTVGMPQSGSTWIHNIVLNTFYVNNLTPLVALFTMSDTVTLPDHALEDKHNGLFDLKIVNFFTLCNWINLRISYNIVDGKLDEFITMKDLERSKLIIKENKLQFSLNDNQARKYSSTPYLIKEHHYSSELMDISDLLIVVKRDIRDSISSRRKRGKGLYSKGKRAIGMHKYDENTFDGFKKYCDYLCNDCFDQWKVNDKKNICLFIDYEDEILNKRKTVETIYEKIHNLLISTFNLPCEFFLDEKKEKIDLILKNTSIENIKEDNNQKKYTTFFSIDKITNNGIPGGYKENLSDQEIKFIETNYSDYIFNKGNT